MSDFPPAPPVPPSLDYERKPEPRAPLWPAIGLVLLLVVVVGAMFSFLRAEPETVKPVASPAPSEAPSFREFTQEQLDKKSDVVAFFLQRGQNEGAQRVMLDFLEGTGCKHLWSGYQVFSSRAAADERIAKFKVAAAHDFPGATISTGIAKIEPQSDLRPAKFMVAGIVLDCP